jgi:hypothetical protein
MIEIGGDTIKDEFETPSTITKATIRHIVDLQPMLLRKAFRSPAVT